MIVRGSEEAFEVPTPSGLARVRLTLPGHSDGAGSGGLLCLGHGAGGGTDAPDLVAVTDAAASAGWTVARIDQPYRVAGRRAPAPAPRLDDAWLAVVAVLRGRFGDRPLVTGGRSSGARVACRTATASGACGVVCLAFPLRPPRRPHSSTTPKSRLDELVGQECPPSSYRGSATRSGGRRSFPRRSRWSRCPATIRCGAAARHGAAEVVGWLAQRVA